MSLTIHGDLVPDIDHEDSKAHGKKDDHGDKKHGKDHKKDPKKKDPKKKDEKKKDQKKKDEKKKPPAKPKKDDKENKTPPAKPKKEDPKKKKPDSDKKPHSGKGHSSGKHKRILAPKKQHDLHHQNDHKKMCLFFSFVFKENIGDFFNLYQRGNMMKTGSFRIALVKEVAEKGRVVVLDINFSDHKTKEVIRIRFRGNKEIHALTK
jgi:hypothetical protein